MNLNFITDQERQHFRARHKYANAEEMLQYAMRNADAYAEHNAGDMLPSIKRAIALLHFRYCLQGDMGEKKLIRLAIDTCLAMGRAIANASD